MTVIDLPMPPSANNLFYNRRRTTGRPGRGLTPEYCAWRDSAGWHLKIARPRKIKGPVTVDIAISETARGDADNRIKPLLDLLVTHQIIEGDSKAFVRSVTSRWSPDVSGVRVTIAPVTG